jgi:hypothetical protein
MRLWQILLKRMIAGLGMVSLMSDYISRDSLVRHYSPTEVVKLGKRSRLRTCRSKDFAGSIPALGINLLHKFPTTFLPLFWSSEVDRQSVCNRRKLWVPGLSAS